MFGGGGMYSESGGWAAALLDRRYWSRERWRTTAALADGEIKYDLQLGDVPESALRVQQAFRGFMLAVDRNVSRNAWIGVTVIAGESPVRIANLPPEVDGLLPSISYESTSVSLNAEWDTRDDSFWPRGGTYATVTAGASRSHVLGDSDHYRSYGASYNRYLPWGDRGVLALRAHFAAVDGDAPFFALPWFGSGADLRGYTPGRFIGRNLAAGQAEWRVQTGKRFGFVVFAGVGGVFGEVENFEQDSLLPAAGVGLRWRLTRKLPINFRIDYARGRNDDSLTISVGEAF